LRTPLATADRTEEETMATRGKLVIVAGVEFDATADAVWDKAQTLLWSRPDAVLHVCHVIRNDVAAELKSVKGPFDSAFERLHTWVVEKAGAKDAPICLQIHLEVVIGQPVNELVQAAVDVDADLILVGTHARGPVAKIVLGSVAEGVMKQAPCSVLVARPTDFSNRHKSPSISPAPEQGHHAYHPHAAARRSIAFGTYTAGLRTSGVS
jgi:nucleotide-binding universal stress UspA family protein